MHRFCTAAAAFVATFALSAQPLREFVTWDNIKAHPAPLPVIGEIQARPSVLDAPSLWSVGMETMDRDYAVFDNFSQYIGQTGVGYGRLQSGWAKTEQKKGKYDFSWLDAHVDGMIERGIRPWIWLCGDRPSDSLERALLDVRIKGTEITDPVYVDLVSGYVHSLAFDRAAGALGLKALPLWDAPVLIIDRSAVPVASN